MGKRYAYTEGNQLYEVETGEIVDKRELKLAAEQKLLETSRKIRREMIEVGVYLNVQVIKDNFGEEWDSINLKEGYEFNKIFRVELIKLYNDIQLCSESYAFIGRFTPCLHFPSNTLLLNGTHPTQEEMQKAVGFGKTKLNEVLKELEFYDIIKREKINGKTYIFFNPFLYSTGVLAMDTYKLFRDSIFNPYKVKSEDANNKEDKKAKKARNAVI